MGNNDSNDRRGLFVALLDSVRYLYCDLAESKPVLVRSTPGGSSRSCQMVRWLLLQVNSTRIMRVAAVLNCAERHTSMTSGGLVW